MDKTAVMKRKITISGVGCALIDNIYNNISFESPVFQKYLSKRPGDGGLSPGKLVFTEEFEKFAQKPFQEALSEITVNKPVDAQNIGGPCLVALINAAQMTYGKNVEVKFFGALGDDKNGNILVDMLASVPMSLEGYQTFNNTTPFTDVFSDPTYNNGEGERLFLNNIGAAWDIAPDNLSDDFFKADIHVYGGTALVPKLHDNLAQLLKKNKQSGAITIVNTVYDFRNEKKNPEARWPMGKSDETYGYIDCLITDHEEALKLSGQKTPNRAIDFFTSKGVGSCIITNGARPVHLVANRNPFMVQDHVQLPISDLVKAELATGRYTGDTTGCGDNFVGGAVASIAEQLLEHSIINLVEACSWGIASGGYACFYIGGTYREDTNGEKQRLVIPYIKDYKKQTGLI